MSKGRWLKDPRALQQADKLYSFIGQYVIGFQWLESKIDEIGLRLGQFQDLGVAQPLVRDQRA